MKMQTNVKAGGDSCCGGINILSNNDVAVGVSVGIAGVGYASAKA